MLVVSLFDYTGIWSQPYRDAGYDVLQVDIQHGKDIYLTPLPDKPVRGIIAQPPCTDFALSGAKWFAEKDKDGRTASSIMLVREALRWIEELEPDWWVVENPMSRIHKMVPELGPVKYQFDPCDFGDPYTKRTWLWGEFNTDLKKTPVKPLGVNPGKNPDWYNKVGGKSIATKNYRSKTSRGFARAFFDANR